MGAALIGLGGLVLVITPFLPWVERHNVLAAILAGYYLVKYSWVFLLPGPTLMVLVFHFRRSHYWLKAAAGATAAIVGLVASPGIFHILFTIINSGGDLGVGPGLIALMVAEVLLILGAIAPAARETTLGI